MIEGFSELLAAVRSCSDEQKQKIFSEIRESVLIHNLEKSFNVRAEVILEAISRATDLTQRGVRGVIAETVFALEVIPRLDGWHDDPPVGDLSFDACLCKGTNRVRIQVKMQRKERGQPKMRGDYYIVEVQRTRSGTRDGIKTRPYRFGEFDLIAVCMEPSTSSWSSFMYAPALLLEPDLRDKKIIKTFQQVPAFSHDDREIWTSNLQAALAKFG